MTRAIEALHWGICGLVTLFDATVEFENNAIIDLIQVAASDVQSVFLNGKLHLRNP